MRPWLHAQHLDRQHQHLRPPVPAPKRHLPQRPGRPLLLLARILLLMLIVWMLLMMTTHMLCMVTLALLATLAF